MAFSETLKRELRSKSNFKCCLCQTLGVEIHHIVPQTEGGKDTKENAAPLCPSCHETYGGNPSKRKFIREARDSWLKKCDSFASLEEISQQLKQLATKEDIARLSVSNTSYSLGEGYGIPDNPYSFVSEEFVHPLIVRELSGWISDLSAAVVAVDLTAANRSNQFFGDFMWYGSEGGVTVICNGERGEYFTYEHIAESHSGVHMVSCRDCGGGSGVFCHVGLFAFQCDRVLSREKEMTGTRDRILVKSLGSIGLGDRYAGNIVYQDGFLKIQANQGPVESLIKQEVLIPIA